MARATVPRYRRELGRVRRRLFLQRLLDTLSWAWLVAFLLATGWFLAEPFVLRQPPSSLRWAVCGVLCGLAVLVALVLSFIGRTSPVGAALALDQRCQLRERVTTVLLLSSSEAVSPAARALLADVDERLEPLRVADAFPVRLHRSFALVPAAALGLTLVALFYHPTFPGAPAEERLADNPAVVAEIEQKLRQLEKKPAARPEERNRSAEQERFDTELDKLARQPRDTKEQAREVVKEMTTLEEQMRKREQELADKAAALKAQLAQAERTTRKRDKDGPAKDLASAVKQGDFEKARQEAEHLARQIQQQDEIDSLRKKRLDESLTPQERDRINEQLQKLGNEPLNQPAKEGLQEQLQDLERKLERLSRSRDKLEQALRDQARKGEISQEELDRELDQLRDMPKLDQQTLDCTRKMAQKLADARKCLAEGKLAEAAQKLDELARELEKADCDGQACQLRNQLAQLRAARLALCQALDGQPTPAAGRRPESAEKPTQFKEERARAPFDKGRLQVIDHVPGGGFKGPRKPAEMVEDIRRAAQEAPEAIDRQRLPRSASDMARGYFEKLRGNDKPGAR